MRSFRNVRKILSENIERWGVSNAIVTNHAPAELPHFSGFLIGSWLMLLVQEKEMFRKDPKCNKKSGQKNLRYTVKKRQQEILSSAIKMLKKIKGQLIYSTCTFAPEENEEIISWLVENYPVTIEEIPLTQSVSSGRSEWGSVAGFGKQYVYGLIKIRVKGHFVAKLTFHGQNQMHKEKKTRKK